MTTQLTQQTQLNCVTIDKGCPAEISGFCEVCLEPSTLPSGNTIQVPLSCALNQTDIIANCNKFCIIQLITRKNEVYFLVTRSGRVGLDGNVTMDCFLDRAKAVAAYKAEFQERTGISWLARHSAGIIPLKGKYQYVAMQYDTGVDDSAIPLNKTARRDAADLPKAVQDLIRIIYNKELYSAAKELGVDTEKLPLGALSRVQLQKAAKILQEIAKHGSDKTALSSAFYSIIPTACGMARLPVIENADQIQKAAEMLELLEDLCYLKGDKSVLSSDETDTIEKYLALECNIMPETDPTILKHIESYLTTNAGSTHTIKPKIRAVYNLDKTKERVSYHAFESLHNKQLLWHGTRLANVVGILTSGFRINPAGVATNGKMFGNGLYFANSSTKSAGYMYTRRGEVGPLFLCEVALGNMVELTHSSPITELPIGKHSVRGLGMNQPDMADHVEIGDNVIVPIGALQTTAGKSLGRTLLYDEFIVYNPAQIKLRYLVLVQC